MKLNLLLGSAHTTPTHRHTHSCWPLPLGSVSPRRRPVAPWHGASPQRSCVPAGSDGHGAQWAPLPFDPLPTIHHLTRRGGELKRCCQLAIGRGKKKKRERWSGEAGRHNTVETESEWMEIVVRSLLSGARLFVFACFSMGSSPAGSKDCECLIQDLPPFSSELCYDARVSMRGWTVEWDN